MATKREKDADKLDYALFLALEAIRVFTEAHPHAFSPRPFTGDDRPQKALDDAKSAISKLRHYYVRPMMDATQREETA